ncbi:CcdB family protein [Endozoicomonas sp.]|uniref:CcdB family protein n=1 Tax=Endozoicomonas sp. TaxID=1892382 RepID=UPI002884FF1B|nr:CcdB family protein [Endozoicomonas sp.]
MANQFDVYRLDNLMVVVLQNNFAETATTVVAPLLPKEKVNTPLTGLMPEVELSGALMVVDVPALAAIRSNLLRARSGELTMYREPLLSALDLLFTGF